MNGSHYTPTAKLLHWLVAGMIVVQFVLAQLADNAPSDLRELALLANHKSVGITILVVAMVRVAWRLLHTPPALPATMPRWQVTASAISHWSLYALLFAVPVTGWLMSSASAYSVSWFNLFQLPDFVSPNPDLKDVFEEIHEILARLLLVIASVHVAAALKHAVIDKDKVLNRILSRVSLVAFVLIAAFGTAWLGSPGDSRPSGALVTPVTPPGSGPGVEDTASSELPIWRIDYSQSFIRFTGDQAGATFEGVWDSWSASLQFSPDDLAGGAFDVTVDTSSGNTQDAERDLTLKDPEWFDPTNFPAAYFRADQFSDSADGDYIADGELVIKNLSAPARLLFSIEADGYRTVLRGTAQLDRLALGVGTGEWEDTDWVGKDVTVNVQVVATVSD
jgi:cytochrome b561